MTKQLSLRILFISGLVFIPLHCLAVSFETGTVGDKTSVRTLGVDFIPELKITEASTNNLLKSDSNKVSSLHTIVRPSVKAQAASGLNVFEGEFATEENYFTNTGNWNYNYEALSTKAKANLDFTPRNRLKVDGQYLLTQENPGEGFSQGAQIRRNNAVMLNGNTFPYDFTQLETTYEFGHREATGRIELFGDTQKFHYGTTPALPYNPDRIGNKLGGRFHLKLSPKTAVLFGAGQTKTRYNDYELLDSDEQFWEIGANLNPTGKVSVDSRIGQSTRTQIHNENQKSKAPSYSLAASWSPLSYSRFTLSATQAFEEPIGYGAFSKTNTVDLNWNHEWNSRFATFARLEHQKITNDAGSGAFGLTQNQTSTGNVLAAGFTYRQQRWLNWELAATRQNRSSDSILLNYHESQIRLGIQLSL